MTDLVAKLITPEAPNYVLVELPSFGSCERMERPKVRVADLTEEQKDEIARLWRLELDAVAAQQRENS